MELKPNSELQGGKYRIVQTLGQGGFGITYLGEHTLMGRKVCIKEFFLKEYCDRDEQTSQVSLGTSNNRDRMEKYQAKFVKEAKLIATLDHPNVIKIHDVFYENNTAYYVMDYIDGVSLNDMVKKNGALPEATALRYIKSVGEGLAYVHDKGINHLDVKPGNIMIGNNDKPVLIDFGMSKQYDEGGDQTSSTPVGISEGYAPLEQYNVGGVSTFSPQTDVYSLAATLYRLVTGQVPPRASEVMNEGLPEFQVNLSESTKAAIEKAMQFRKKDRPSTVSEFLSMLAAVDPCDVAPVFSKGIAADDDSCTTVLDIESESPVDTASLKLVSADSRMKAISALANLGFSDDAAFDIVMNLPYTLYSDSEMSLVSKAKEVLENAGCVVNVSNSLPGQQNVGFLIKSVTSKISALSALASLGISDDEAFDLLSDLPNTLFGSMEKDEALETKAILENAGCVVELVSATKTSTKKLSIDYRKYCDSFGELNEWILKSELDDVIQSLKMAASDGDDYASYLLSDFYERLGYKELAISYADKAIASSDRLVSLRGRLQMASLEKDGDEKVAMLKSLRGRGDSVFNNLVDIHLFVTEFFESADDELDKFRNRLERFENDSDQNTASMARLLHAMRLLCLDEVHGDEITDILAPVSGNTRCVADTYLGALKVFQDDYSAALKLFERAISIVEPYSIFYFQSLVYYWAGLFYANEGNPYCNHAKALELFTKGSESGNEECLYWLGQMYMDGLGCTRDLDKAISCLERAKEGGSSDADEALEKALAIKNRRVWYGCHLSYESDSKNHSITCRLDVECTRKPFEKMFGIAFCLHDEPLSEAIDVLMMNSSEMKEVESYSNGTYSYNGLSETFSPNSTSLSEFSSGYICLDVYVLLMEDMGYGKQLLKIVSGRHTKNLKEEDVIAHYVLELEHKSYVTLEDEWILL